VNVHEPLVPSVTTYHPSFIGKIFKDSYNDIDNVLHFEDEEKDSKLNSKKAKTLVKPVYDEPKAE